MAGIEAGLLNILIGPKLVEGFAGTLAGDLDKSLGPVAEQTGKSFSQKLSDGANKAGKTLTAGVTAPILAIGAAAIAAEDQIGEALDTIRTGTGATGPAFDQLREDFESVAKTASGSFARTGEVIADLNTRLQLSGEPLRVLADQILDLEKITGNTVNLDTFTRVISAFGVPADQATATLDKLFRASQATGVTFDNLTTKLVSQSAAFAELGFGLDETAALLAQFEKAGVNTGTVLAGLRANIVKAAKDGQSAADFFRESVTTIQGFIAAGDEAAAQAAAKELFGARTFLDALDAIRRGQFDIEGTLNAIENGTDTVNGLAAEFEGIPEKLERLKKSAALALLPLGEAILPLVTTALDKITPIVERLSGAFENLSPGTQQFIIIAGGLLAALGPALLIFAKVVTAITTITGVLKTLNITLTLSPWFLVAAAAVAAVVLIIANWDKVAAFFANLWDGIQKAFTAAFEFIKKNWSTILAVITGPIGLAVLAVTKNWDKIKQGFSNAVEAIKRTAGNVGNAILAPFRAVGDAAVNVFNRLRDGAKRAIEFIANLFRNLPKIIQNAFGAILKLPGFNVIANIASGLSKIRIPGFADGGNFPANKPMIVGERGPELLVPRASGAILPNNVLAGVLGSGGATYNVVINNPVAEPAASSIPAALRRANLLRGSV